MKRLGILFTLALSSALLCGGCGGSPETDAAASSGPPSSPPSAAAPAPAATPGGAGVPNTASRETAMQGALEMQRRAGSGAPPQKP